LLACGLSTATNSTPLSINVAMNARRSAVLDYLDGGSWTMFAEFTEVESGKHADRPQLAAALAACKKHKAKLVIAKLDRCASRPNPDWPCRSVETR
jgi:DNA invertase Pin-like site-specific DNA recombinase